MGSLDVMTEQRFDGGAFEPPVSATGKWRFEERGAVAEPGGNLLVELDPPCEQVEIELDLTADDVAGIVVSLGAYHFQLGTERRGVSTIRSNMNHRVAEGVQPVLATGVSQTARMTYGPDGLSLEVSGQPALRGTHPDLLTCVRHVLVAGQPGMRLEGLRVKGTPLREARRRALRPRERFGFAMTIDFPDDFLYAERPWEEADLRAVVAELQELGVSRVYWIYNGGKEYGKYAEFERLFFGKRTGGADDLFARVPSPLGVIADEAHRRGMTAYGIIKPYDIGNNLRTLPDDPDRLPPGPKRIWRCGGYAMSPMPFLGENQHLLMKRHPYGTDPALQDKKVSKVRLYAHDDSPFPFAASDVQLLVSDDNDTYRPYDGPVAARESVESRPEVVYHWAGNRSGTRRADVRVLTLDGLDIRAKYFAVRLDGPADRPFVRNRLCALAEIFDERGEAFPFTLGVDPKRSLSMEGDRHAWVAGTLESTGCNFEFNFGIPSFAGDGANMTSWWVVDSNRPFLAFCRGKSPHMTAPCYAHKPMREWLLAFVESCLATGVDGIDFRLNSHCTTFEPRAYGFDEPVVEEFRRRYGTDPLTEDFDWTAWQKLQSESTTQLMREVSALLRSRGRKCQVHLGHYNSVSETWPAYMNRYLDWESWLREGLFDEVTHKDNSEDSPLCRHVRAVCDELGIPFMDCRRHWSGLAAETWGERQGRLARVASEVGMDGCILYENFEAIRLGATPGTVRLVAPEIAEAIRELRR